MVLGIDEDMVACNGISAAHHTYYDTCSSCPAKDDLGLQITSGADKLDSFSNALRYALG